jgi:hypothetical protein
MAKVKKHRTKKLPNADAINGWVCPEAALKIEDGTTAREIGESFRSSFLLRPHKLAKPY